MSSNYLNVFRASLERRRQSSWFSSAQCCSTSRGSSSGTRTPYPARPEASSTSGVRAPCRVQTMSLGNRYEFVCLSVCLSVLYFWSLGALESSDNVTRKQVGVRLSVCLSFCALLLEFGRTAELRQCDEKIGRSSSVCLSVCLTVFLSVCLSVIYFSSPGALQSSDNVARKHI